MVKDGLHDRETEEVSQYITQNYIRGIQSILLVDTDPLDSDLETLLQSHSTRKKHN